MSISTSARRIVSKRVAGLMATAPIPRPLSFTSRRFNGPLPNQISRFCYYTTRKNELMDPTQINRLPQKHRRVYRRSKIEEYIVRKWIPKTLKLAPDGIGIKKLWDDIKIFLGEKPKKWLSGETVKSIVGELARRDLITLWRKSSSKIKLMMPSKSQLLREEEEGTMGRWEIRDLPADAGGGESDMNEDDISYYLTNLEQQKILSNFQKIEKEKSSGCSNEKLHE